MEILQIKNYKFDIFGQKIFILFREEYLESFEFFINPYQMGMI